MTLRKKAEGIYVDDSGVDVLARIDALIFDCDGVLIDITKSYDFAIIKTAQHILENLAKIDDAISINFKIIEGFKSTGGFNDEVDLTYAAVLSLIAAKKLKADQTSFVFDVIKNADSTGISSVEKYINSLVDISDMTNQLSYPGSRDQSLLRRTFDQLFYGPQLYQKLFGNTSPFSEPGLIEQDKVILDSPLMNILQKKFHQKIAMVTGRSKKSVEYSLKSLLEKFDIRNSVFLEDEPRSLAKPNPLPLLNTIRRISSRSSLYIGDSMEDLLMVNRASELTDQKPVFCGIIGTSKNPQEKLELFEQNGAVLVLDSIHLLPKVLNLK